MDDLQHQHQRTNEAVAETLGHVPGIREREQALFQRGPAPDSEAGRTRKLPGGRYAEIMASGYLAVAGDNLLTWRAVVLAKIQPAYGHLSLLRTAVECAVNARWLLDPSISAASRIARGLAAQRVDYEERKKVEATIRGGPKMKAPGKSAVERLDDLKHEQVANGIPNEPMNVTSAARSYLVGSGSGEGSYRLLSAFAHGKSWSLLASDKRTLLGMNPPPQGRISQVTASDEFAVGMTNIAVMTYAAAVTDLGSYFLREPVP
ncbi:MAG: hypothetical protein AABZ33_01175 [Chloroflexota bacterium]